MSLQARAKVPECKAKKEPRTSNDFNNGAVLLLFWRDNARIISDGPAPYWKTGEILTDLSCKYSSKKIKIKGLIMKWRSESNPIPSFTCWPTLTCIDENFWCKLKHPPGWWVTFLWLNHFGLQDYADRLSDTWKSTLCFCDFTNIQLCILY